MAAVDTGAQISLWDPDFISFRFIQEEELLVCTVVLFLIVWGTSEMSSTVAASIYAPTNSGHFLHILAGTRLLSFGRQSL